MFKTVLEATTSAAKVVVITERSNNLHSLIPPTIWATGLGISEAITIQFPVVSDPDPDTDAHWTTPKAEGASIEITADNTFVSPFSVSKIRLNKPSTAAGVGVYMESE